MTEVSKDKLTIFQITGQGRSENYQEREGTGSSSQDFDAKGSTILSKVAYEGQLKRWSLVVATETSL